MKKFFNQSILAIEKGQVQLVGSFELRVCPHGVLGPLGLREFAKSIAFEVSILSNDRDWLFSESTPFHPVVLNNENSGAVMGISDSALLQSHGFPSTAIGVPLLTQFRLVVEDGYARGYLDEIILLSSLDKRGDFLTMHQGPAPLVANSWTYKNGVAIPGLFPSTKHATEGLRRFLAGMNLILVHGMIRQTLEGTSRSKQGKMTAAELKVASQFYDWLCLDGDQRQLYRYGPGMTSGIGSSGIHLDAMNSSDFLQSHSNWGVYYHEDLQRFVKSKPALEKLERSKIGFQNRFSIHLAYSRQIITSQAQKLSCR
jgi:hypothetical protein